MHRNAVYGHAEWAMHKSSWRHGRHIQTAFSTGVISSIIPPVFFCTLISVIVTIFNHAVLEGLLPHWVPSLRVPALPMSLTAPVLSLLLVFRTNSSYNRFDEARKAWGSNVNRARDVTRQALSWICVADDVEKLQSLLRHIKAFSYCLKDHLTQDNSLREELTRVLEPREMELVLQSSHRPNYVLQVMSDTIKHCRVSKWESKSMDRNITQFHDNVGACERIFKTPIPVAYTRMISRFLSIWHFLLPLALWNSCRWLTIPVTFVSGVGLFCIEEVGVLIEEPFYILALTSISDGISSAVDGLCSAHEGALKMWSSGLCPGTCKLDQDQVEVHVIAGEEKSRDSAALSEEYYDREKI